MIVLDEPTSALDSTTAALLICYLQQVKRSKIIILITHDELIQGYCDEVVRIGE